MDANQEKSGWRLFTLRFWSEALGEGQTEWRGQVQHVTSGETRYFREWSKLVAFLQESLPTTAASEDTSRTTADRREGSKA
jgi:hypothetical protein